MGLPSFCDRCFSTVKIRFRERRLLLSAFATGLVGMILELGRWIPLDYIPFGMSHFEALLSFIFITYATLLPTDVFTELIPEANKIPEGKVPKKIAGLTVCMRCMGPMDLSWKECPHCGVKPAQSEVAHAESKVEHAVGKWILVPLLLGILFGVPAWLGYERITEFIADSNAQKIRDAEARKPPPISHYATATSISYRDALLRRIPLGTLIVVDGKVSQTWNKKVSIRLSINHDLVHVEFDKMPEVVEEDLVSIFGRYNGVVTYKTISGSDNTVPNVFGDYLKVVKPRI
jgi:hypothetical protein